jgi:serine/threonine protein kinase
MHHENFLDSIGWCRKGDQIYVVKEPFEGHLEHLKEQEFYGKFDWQTTIHLAIGVACAVNYLHNSNKGTFSLINFRPSQFVVTTHLLVDSIGFWTPLSFISLTFVLLHTLEQYDSEFEIKLADFDLSAVEIASRAGVRCPRFANDPAFRAPEFVNSNHGNCNEKADIYSLGTCSCLPSLPSPFFSFSSFKIFSLQTGSVLWWLSPGTKQSKPTTKMDWPEKGPEEYHKIVESCWNNEPRLRPTARDVVKGLLDLCKRVSNFPELCHCQTR